MSSRKKKKGLLETQKPRKRFKLSSQTKYRLLGLSSIAALFYFGKPYLDGLLSQNLGMRDEIRRPQLVLDHPFQEQEKQLALSLYQKLTRFDARDLRDFAQRLQQELGLRSITMVQTQEDIVYLKTVAYSPALLVALDRLRFVSSDGVIYGEASEPFPPAIPVMKGLHKKDFLEKQANGSFQTSADNHAIIKNALLAIQEGKTYNIHYRSLSFDPFRGYSAELDLSRFHIVLGFYPFTPKYQKLEKILTNLKERGIAEAMIELDYKGKAFVKESLL